MKYLLLMAGVIITALALFSFQLGLDNDAGWGRGRIALLIAGILSIALSAAIHLLGNAAGSALRKLKDFIEYKMDRGERIGAVTLIATLVVIASYFWFIQLDGRIAGFEFEYYIETAKSFKKGQLHIDFAPPPELLALDNPYDYFLRKQEGVDNFPWDLSLYKGKFYIYWGPTPAVLAALLSRDLLNRMGDFHLALAAACGLFIYQSLIISTFWRRSLKYAPAWLLGILLIVVGLMTPVPMMLNGAKVYDAAIFSCQFFLIGGCYWAYSALLDDSPSSWKLFLASAHWGLSAGSRIIILPGMLLCAATTLLFVFQANRRNGSPMVKPFLALAIPILLAGAGLAWYNWARFDSIFEFGLTYQLANIDYTNFTNVFNTSRFPLNTRLYLAYPLGISPRFPFLERIEYVNSNERLAGLIFIAPYIFLLAIPIIRRLGNVRLFDNKASAPISRQILAGFWLSFSLLGISIISITIIFSYYFPAIRFVEDFMPAMSAFITIQTGLQYDALQNNPFFRRIFSGVVLILAGISVLANILLAVPVEGIRFAINLLNDIYKLLGLK